METSKLLFFPAVSLVVSNSCRMKCKFCCDNGTHRNVLVEKNKILQIIQLLGKYGTKRICFTGGEPLLSKDLPLYLRKAKSLQIENTLMSSDGNAIRNLQIDKKDIDLLWLSIHGLCQYHDDITSIQGSFNELEKAIDYNSNKYNIAIWCVLTKQNNENVIEFLNWCKIKNIKRVYLSNLSPLGKGSQFIKEYGKLSSEEFNNIFNIVKEKYKDEILISGQAFQANAQCIVIYPNGEIYISPCFDCENSQKLLGNILLEDGYKIFQRLREDENLWKDYSKKLIASTMKN